MSKQQLPTRANVDEMRYELIGAGVSSISKRITSNSSSAAGNRSQMIVIAANAMRIKPIHLSFLVSAFSISGRFVAVFNEYPAWFTAFLSADHPMHLELIH